jgi:hypothetical protein
MNPHTTHEPPQPTDWPHGHVGVILTGPDQDECLAVRIHDSVHYLHATTARELQKMLQSQLSAVNRQVKATNKALDTSIPLI